jgi:hypothetical protein
VTEPIEPIRRRRRTVLPIPPLARRRDPDDWDEVRDRREDAPPPRRPAPPPREEPGEGHVDIRA